VLDHLDDANFGDLASVGQQLASGVAHTLAAYAEELYIGLIGALRELAAQCLHELCAIKFA
jgi:hypothetical protein